MLASVSANNTSLSDDSVVACDQVDCFARVLRKLLLNVLLKLLQRPKVLLQLVNQILKATELLPENVQLFSHVVLVRLGFQLLQEVNRLIASHLLEFALHLLFQLHQLVGPLL